MLEFERQTTEKSSYDTAGVNHVSLPDQLQLGD